MTATIWLTDSERTLLARDVLGNAEPSTLMVRAVERIVAGRVDALTAERDQWQRGAYYEARVSHGWREEHVHMTARAEKAEAEVAALRGQIDRVKADAQYDRCADRYLVPGSTFRAARGGDRMSALGWLGFAAVIIAVAGAKLSYRIEAWWARDRIAEAMAAHPAGSEWVPEPTTLTYDTSAVVLPDTEWARWSAEAAERAKWDTADSLYSNETAQKVAAILAHNEAERAWRDPDAVRRFMEGSR